MANCQRAVGNRGLRREVRAQEFDCRPHGGCGDGQAHQSLALLDVYRGRGWERQRNQQGGKTKVTKRSIAEVPARWFFCWRFGRRGDLRASLRQNGIDLFLDLPRFPAAAGSLHPGLRLCRPEGWTPEAQVIAQKRGANLGHRANIRNLKRTLRRPCSRHYYAQHYDIKMVI